MTEDTVFRHCSECMQVYSTTTEKERRERIATAVLAGFASRNLINVTEPWYDADLAVKWADALIKELDRE